MPSSQSSFRTNHTQESCRTIISFKTTRMMSDTALSRKSIRFVHTGGPSLYYYGDNCTAGTVVWHVPPTRDFQIQIYAVSAMRSASILCYPCIIIGVLFRYSMLEEWTMNPNFEGHYRACASYQYACIRSLNEQNFSMYFQSSFHFSAVLWSYSDELPQLWYALPHSRSTIRPLPLSDFLYLSC